MKVNVKIEWLIDDVILNISTNNSPEYLEIDLDNVKSDSNSIDDYLISLKKEVSKTLNHKYCTALFEGADYVLKDIDGLTELLTVEKIKNI